MSSSATSASPTTSTSFDGVAGLREYHRLQDRALPWIKQLSATRAVPHPAVVDFNQASERYMRAADAPGMHRALAALQEACVHLERIAAPATNVVAMPPPGSTNVPRGLSPSARRPFRMRKSFLARLARIAAQGVQGGSPSSIERLVSLEALRRTEQILDAGRRLRRWPEAQLAPLAREHARLVLKQRQLRESGIVDAHALDSSEARGRRLLAVYTAATPRELARALAAYEAFLDGLPRSHAAAADGNPTTTTTPPPPPPNPHDDDDVYDPFGVLAGL